MNRKLQFFHTYEKGEKSIEYLDMISDQSVKGY